MSSFREVMNLSEADQFQWSGGQALSQFECGFYACLMAASMAPNGKPPTMTARQVSDQAQSWYAAMDGSNAGWNTNGMSIQQEYDLLGSLNLHYQSIDMNATSIKAWVGAGYPVIGAIEEPTVYDLDTGGNPYPWKAAGNHVVLFTGVTMNGHLFVRDSANCTNLYDPNSLRPGPRRYDHNRLAFVSATAIVPSWLPRPTSNQPPTPGGRMALSKLFHDDGQKLVYLENKHFFVHGFRALALDSMAKGEDPANWIPLEEEHASPEVELHANTGEGNTQLTTGFKLIWTKGKGVKRSAAGAEILECYKQIAALKVLETKNTPKP